MLYATSVFTGRHLDFAPSSKSNRLILHCTELSKQGQIPFSKAKEFITQFKDPGKKIQLQIDLPIFDDDLSRISNLITSEILDICDLRIEDVGLANSLLKKNPNSRWYLLLPYHSKTAEAWLAWHKHFSQSLLGLVVSSEMDVSDLSTEIQTFKKTAKNSEIELLAAGRILLFYSLRKLKNVGEYLLTPQDRKGSPDLRLFSNNFGFGIYFGKDIFLLDSTKLKNSPLDCLRLDLYQDKQWEVFNDLYPHQNDWEKELKLNWGIGTCLGFFEKNRSSNAFRLLKNKHISRDLVKSSKTKIVGHSIEYVKNSHSLIKLEKFLTLPCLVTFTTPDGFRIQHNLTSAKNLEGVELKKTLCPDYYMIEPIKRTVFKSLMTID